MQETGYRSFMKLSPVALFGADGDGGEGGKPDPSKNDPSGSGGVGGVDNDPGGQSTSEAKPETFDADYVSKIRGEAASRRVAEKDALELAKKLQAELDTLKQAEMNDLEKAKAMLESHQKEAADSKAKAEKFEASLTAERIMNAVKMAALEANFQDPDDALSMISQDELVDDDGQVVDKTVKARLKALADKKPYLLKKASSGSGDGGAGTKAPEDETGFSAKVDAYRKHLTETGGRIVV